MVSLLGRREMMVQMASAVEPNVTITDFLGNGASSIELDIGMSNPTYLVFFSTTDLVSGTFPNNNGQQRLFQMCDPDFAKDLYANTRSSTSSGGYLSVASSALLTYSNGVLSFAPSSNVWRSDLQYRLIAINPNGNQTRKLAIASITGNGQGSISVDLGNISPSILILYPTTPMTSGSFPNKNGGEWLFQLSDTSLQQSAMLYSTTRSNTSTGGYYSYSAYLPTYSNGVLTVGVSTVLRDNYAYKIIAIE